MLFSGRVSFLQLHFGPRGKAWVAEHPFEASWVGKLFIKHGPSGIILIYMSYVLLFWHPNQFCFETSLDGETLGSMIFMNIVTKCPTDLGSESRRRLLWLQDISWSWELVFTFRCQERNMTNQILVASPSTLSMAPIEWHHHGVMVRRFPGDLNVLRLRSLHFPSTLLGRSSWHQPGDSLCWCSIMDKSPENCWSFEKFWKTIFSSHCTWGEGNRNYMNE